MKQYDKIYIPHDPQIDGKCFDDNYHVSHEGFGGPDMKRVEVVPKSNVIVLTIEELQDLWNAAQIRTMEIGKMAIREEVGLPDVTLSPNFKTYLISKGITP